MYDNIHGRESMTKPTRPISWISAVHKEFASFPQRAQAICLAALTIAAEGGMADIAKPLKGLGSGVFELALKFRGDALWVIHAFKKKSTHGIKTPKHVIELAKERLKRLKEILR
jgi:phage-related protein